MDQVSKFSKCSFFFADELSFYNFLALGYSEQEAIRKTKKEDNHLKNKVISAIKTAGFSENHLLFYKDLKEQKKFQILDQKYTNLLIENDLFVSTCQKVIQNLQFQNKNTINPAIAIHYFLKELPFLLATPLLLDQKSSIVVYHDCNVIHRFLFDNFFHLPQQGFLELKINN